MSVWDGKVLVTGGHGFIGSKLVSILSEEGLVEQKDIVMPRSREVDLRDAVKCQSVVDGASVVIHLAANVGGIGYLRNNPGSVFYDNAVMGMNVIEACRVHAVKKLVCVGSVLSYPENAPLPYNEKDLWKGSLHPEVAAYGLAKLHVLAHQEYYFRQYGLKGAHVIPVNVYGPGKKIIDWSTANVIPSLIRKVYLAKKERRESVSVWGSGKATRDFLYIDDAVQGIIRAVESSDEPEPINIGSGEEVRIEDLVTMIMDILGYQGSIQWDTSKPDGQPRMICDITRARERTGFVPRTRLQDGLMSTVDYYLPQLKREFGLV